MYFNAWREKEKKPLHLVALLCIQPKDKISVCISVMMKKNVIFDYVEKNDEKNLKWWWLLNLENLLHLLKHQVMHIIKVNAFCCDSMEKGEVTVSLRYHNHRKVNDNDGVIKINDSPYQATLAKRRILALCGTIFNTFWRILNFNATIVLIYLQIIL